VGILVTGGAGFIGSNLIRYLLSNTTEQVTNLDKLTYAANPQSLQDLVSDPRYHFVQLDITDAEGLSQVFRQRRPRAVIHLAAESHVDRSIDGPAAFVQANFVGTFTVLQASRAFHDQLSAVEREQFRFLQVSTDEVFGSLGPTGKFDEQSPYAPRSPYSASKAGADHLARAWQSTYGLPVIVTNCSNNYGPYQFPEKLIPLALMRALRGENIPVYGRGDNIRDWLYVEDHASALWRICSHGRVGQSYNIGANSERSNLEVVELLCSILDELRPRPDGGSYGEQIALVADRPGHDFRYAMDVSKLRRELGWSPSHDFESGLRRTVQWYLDNDWWWSPLLDGSYQLQRLGNLAEHPVAVPQRT
jgi:dTDP-glucose 4,6-dehydratase